MDAAEREKFTKMEQSVEEIKTDISVIKSALIGNELSGDKGVVGKVVSLQTELDNLKDDMRILQEDKATNAVYIKMLTFVLGLVVTTIVGVLSKLIFF